MKNHNQSRTKIWAILCLVIFIIPLACSFPLRSATVTPTFDWPRATRQMALTLTAMPSPTPTDPVETGICAYAWAYKELPEETANLQDIFAAAGYTDYEIRVSAYGENCIDSGTNQVTGFGAMESDFYFTVPVESLEDFAVMGQHAENILNVMKTVNLEDFPGPNDGYVGIRFMLGDQESNLWFELDTGLSGLDAGLHGAELYDWCANN